MAAAKKTSIHETLSVIQIELDAPKNQFNSFGGYNYRSCEDIMEGLKPLLKKHKCHVIVSDDLVEMGGNVYVQATAYLTNAEGEQVKNTAYAREPSVKKGMDTSQITGATSSYARKYALNGLFAIDDNKDADTQNKPSFEEQIENCTNLNELRNLWLTIPTQRQNELLPVFSERKSHLTGDEGQTPAEPDGTDGATDA